MKELFLEHYSYLGLSEFNDFFYHFMERSEKLCSAVQVLLVLLPDFSPSESNLRFERRVTNNLRRKNDLTIRSNVTGNVYYRKVCV